MGMTGDKPPAIEISDFWWRYPSFVGEQMDWTLKNINLVVNQGEFLGVTGRSGAGKSTLCQAILGSIPHSMKLPLADRGNHIRGSVKVMGRTATHVTKSDDGPTRVEGEGITAPTVGLVMQDPENQVLRMNLFHEISFGLQLQGLPPEEIEHRIKEALEVVGLGHLYNLALYTHPTELSGGQKQRAVIAAFIAMRPEILILDEPTSDLDPIGKRSVIETIRVLKEQQGLTIILVEHNPELMLEFADRVGLLDEGKLIALEETKDFYSNVAFLEQRGVAAPEVARIAGPQATNKAVPLTVSEGLSALVPRIEVENVHISPRQPKNTDTLIEARDVWFQYPDGTVALHGAEFTAKAGEYIALLGQNGSGKTTLAKILCGIYEPMRGHVTVLGGNVAKKHVQRELPRHVGYVFQNPDHQIFLRSAYDEIAHGLRNLELDPNIITQRVEETLERVGLVDKRNEDPLFLGKGQRQRLAVASILAMEPAILIVDEPTTGQDYRMSSQLMSMMDDLNASGKTIVIITHDMHIVAEHCQKVVVMHQGRTEFSGSPREFFIEADFLQRCSLEAPPLVRLSIEARKQDSAFPYLLTEEEWLNALKPATFGNGAGGASSIRG